MNNTLTRKLFVLSLLLSFSTALFAQAPAGYYKSAEGKNKHQAAHDIDRRNGYRHIHRVARILHSDKPPLKTIHGQDRRRTPNANAEIGHGMAFYLAARANQPKRQAFHRILQQEDSTG